MTERSLVQIFTEETIFQAPFIWIKNPGAKRDNGMFQPTWHSCMYCNPANKRVDFEDGWLITKYGHEACQLTKIDDNKLIFKFLVGLTVLCEFNTLQWSPPKMLPMKSPVSSALLIGSILGGSS